MSEEIQNKEEGAEVIENQEQQPTPWKIVTDTEEIEQIAKVEETPIVEEIAKTEETLKEEEEVIEVVEEKKEIDEESVLAYIREKGINAQTFDDLKPKEVEELPEDAKKYLEYKKETGRSYSEFLETQKDWKAEDKGVVLMQHLKAENPTLSNEQIERLFKRKYDVTEEYDDDVILDKEIEIEKDYQKGLALLESQKEKYMVRKGFDESLPEDVKTKVQAFDDFKKQQEESAIANEKSRQDFLAKTESVFSKDFEGFKVKVGDAEFKVKPENIEEAKTTLSDLSNLEKKFFDQTTGELKDPQGYYKAIHFAMNADKVAEQFINIGKAMQAEHDEKESKNIRTTEARSVSPDLVDSMKKWKVEKD